MSGVSKTMPLLAAVCSKQLCCCNVAIYDWQRWI